MGLKKFGSGFGRLVGGLGAMISVEATADPNHGPEQAPETNPALEQVAETFAGVESCGLHLREIRLAEEAQGVTRERAYWGNLLADCRNAQLQATLAEQEATLAEQEATLADLDEQLAARGLQIKGDKLFNLEGDLLGYLILENDQVRWDFSPWDNRNENLAAEAAQSLADLEAFLMRSLSEETQ